MHHKLRKQCLATVLSIIIVTSGYTPLAMAGLIGTGDLAQNSVQTRTNAESNLQRSVTHRLIELGVDQKLAQERVLALTFSELQLLDQKLDELPAGAGVLATIGIVFVVLLILELVGIINIFTKI